MISSIASPGSNDLLAGLPYRERDSVLKHGERITLTQDEILAEPGESISHVYFPIDGFILLLAEVDHHPALGVDLIGSEGMLGTSLVLDVDISPLQARVQVSGSALRLTVENFQHALIATPILERQLRRYVNVLLEQMAQTAACAAFHVVEARLACWLLMAHDRAHGDRIFLTHDRLARMLGVRRSGVTTAAGVLQSRKLITYTRGHVVVLDHKGLEHAACGCYRSVRVTLKQIAAPIVGKHELESEMESARADGQQMPRARGDHAPLHAADVA